MSKIIFKTDVQDKYKNPSNHEEILKKLLEVKTYGEVYEIIKETFPDWIIGHTKKYSTDYPHLQKNWEFLCKKFNTTPKEILIVDYVNEGPEFKVLNTFCELMTVAGYCIRRKEEFIGCHKCDSAIPVLELWKDLKERGLQVPKNWSKLCVSC